MDSWIVLFVSILGGVQATPTGDEVYLSVYQGLPVIEIADSEISFEHALQVYCEHSEEIKAIAGAKGYALLKFDHKKEQWFIELYLSNRAIAVSTLPSEYKGVMVRYHSLTSKCRK